MGYFRSGVDIGKFFSKFKVNSFIYIAHSKVNSPMLMKYGKLYNILNFFYHISRYKGSVLVHWVPGAGAGASTKIKYEIIEKVNKI